MLASCEDPAMTVMKQVEQEINPPSEEVIPSESVFLSFEAASAETANQAETGNPETDAGPIEEGSKQEGMASSDAPINVEPQDAEKPVSSI